LTAFTGSKCVGDTDKTKPYSAPTTYPENGPLQKLLAELLTKERVEKLGFIAWSKAQGLVDKAFRQKDANAMRFAFTVAQWVVIGERFGIETAGPEPVGTP
jgi:asparagine synthase (glutamine-hydrolysing)